CHKQRSPAVSSGQSRSVQKGRRTGPGALTWGGGGGRNCMACKGSGVQIPSAPPQVSGPLRPRPSANRPPRAADRQQSVLKGRSSGRHGGTPASIVDVVARQTRAPPGGLVGRDR